MAKTSRTFHLYRFQIVPAFPIEDFDLYFAPQFEIKSAEELIGRKNEIFATALQQSGEFRHPRAELTHQIYQEGNFFVLKIGANRSLIRTTKDFVQEILDHYPYVHVVINNDPDVQLMAVELEVEAFYRTSTVIHILTTNLNARLQRYGLVLEILPVFYESAFWRVVENNKGRVTRVQFFMVAPNLANISKNLELDLGELKNRTNSQQTNLSLTAPKSEALSLSQEDKFTKSLVGYASEGGGTIHVKVKGIRKVVKTEDSIKSLEVDEIYFSGDDSDEVFKQLIDELRKDLQE